MLNVVIPMAGEGKRFRDAGYTVPKPFIEAAGKTMLEWSLKSLGLQDGRFILIARAPHLKGYEQLMERLGEKYPITLLTFERLTEGMAVTVLAAREHINNGEPLLIGACDQTLDVTVAEFVQDARKRGLDGSLMTFSATHPKWSYTKIGEDGLVMEVREKEPISAHANVGVYYFARGRDFVKAAEEMIAAEDQVNGEFYVAPVYNYAIAGGARVGIFEIEEEAMHGLGTPEDLEKFRKENV